MLTVAIQSKEIRLGLVWRIERIVEDAQSARLTDDEQLEYTLRELHKVFSANQWYIYAGGNHIAIHRQSALDDKGQRLIMIAPAPKVQT